MKIRSLLYVLCTSFLFVGCSFLNLRPKDKLDGTALFSDPEGVKVYMANLYSRLPIEDFRYMKSGFNAWEGDCMSSSMFTDESTHSGYNDQLAPGMFSWWDDAFKLLRDVNSLSEVIPTLNLGETAIKNLVGEVAFIKGYIYFGLAKRFGGVPIIDKAQQWEGDADKLKVPRSTEEETWNYLLDQLQIAADNLPNVTSGSNERRADRWAALALKSRAALHAASIAKFGGKAPLSGEAVDKGYVGMAATLANSYYEIAIKAAEEIIDSKRFSLAFANPSSPEEAAENYRLIFEDPNNAPSEVMFVKGYTKLGMGHGYNVFYGPAQTANGWPHPGEISPNLEFVDCFESYDNPGYSAPIVTSSASDDLTNYDGFNPSREYYKFEKPYDIFKNKDARLWGSLILPGTKWKDTEIVIQAGYIKPDGTPVIYSGDSFENPNDGKTYYVFGAANNTDYSGFDTHQSSYTRTGFCFKKFLDQRIPTLYGYLNSLTDYIDIRYAEVLLNYAEAVVESGYTQNNAVEKATDALNSIRRRAAHTVDISLTSENVQRERRVELSFENKRYWDLIRRREYHELFNGNVMHALLPIIDLRETSPKYIFVRTNIQAVNRFTFFHKMYYQPIPGITVNGLVQNPQY